MKIIAGERKGHTLTTPKGWETRPTLTRVRESLFSIIAGDIPGSIFCELFAGAGSIGLEALSRGADRAYFVEHARAPYQCLRQNVERLRYADSAKIFQSDVFRWEIPTGAGAPDIIFADPPYDAAILEKLIKHIEAQVLKENTLLILQTPATYKIGSALQHLRTASYGATALHFLLNSKSDEKASETQPVTGSR